MQPVAPSTDLQYLTVNC